MSVFKRNWWWCGLITNYLILVVFILLFGKNMYKDIVLHISENELEEAIEKEETELAPQSDFPSHLISGLGLLFLFVSVAIVIVIIAIVIRMRRKHNLGKDSEDVEKSKKKHHLDDPYLQAISFPGEPKSHLKKNIVTSIRTATTKITGGDIHKTKIPEELRHQLKHIYVY